MLMGLQKKEDPYNRAKGITMNISIMQSPEHVTSDFTNPSAENCLITLITLYNFRDHIYHYITIESFVEKSAFNTIAIFCSNCAAMHGSVNDVPFIIKLYHFIKCSQTATIFHLKTESIYTHMSYCFHQQDFTIPGI